MAFTGGNTHEYLKRLVAASDSMRSLGAGLAETTVSHDSNCGVYLAADCDCDPEITFTLNGKSYEILAGGVVKATN